MSKRFVSKFTDWFLFLPLGFVYLVHQILFHRDHFKWDEERYLMFADNLLNGFYSPPPPDINLWNGPGYPMVLAVFLALQLSPSLIRMFNSILLFASVVLFFKAGVHCMGTQKRKQSLIVSYLLGLYLPIYFYLSVIHTEVLTWFLICVLIYLMARYSDENRLSVLPMVSISLCISFLAMVKIIFGHVILVTTVCLLLLTAFQRFRSRFVLKYLLIFAVAMAGCVPWLVYTYSLTGKLFYWGNSGGMSLYWMSSPHKKEFGDWSHEKYFDNPELRKNHKVFFDSIRDLSAVEKDEAFKKKAMENIGQNPTKYFFNWVANIGRMLFSYPYSYQNMSLRTFFILIPNMFIVVILTLLLYPTILHWKQIDFGIKILLFFTMVYLAGSSLLSAYKRMFIIVVPVWVFFICYATNRFVTVTFASPVKDTTRNGF